MNNYYQILGITQNATLEQIKKAYRAKAKLYHPDRNKAEGAHDTFILLNEAYEYFVKIKDPKRARPGTKSTQQSNEEFRREWQRREKQKARERAQAYAKMQYEAYLKSDLYRTTEAVNSIVDFFVALFLLLLVVGLPTLLYIEHGGVAVLISGIIILPTSPLWFKFLYNTFNKDALRSFFKIRNTSIRSKVVRLMLFGALNFWCFFEFTLNTLIELRWVLAIYSVAFVVAIFVAKFLKSRYHKLILKFLIAPALLNLFFILNYAFSASPQSQSYWYTYSNLGSRTFNSIYIEDGHYDEYKGMRFFVDFDPFLGNSCVTYTIEDGLFGLKVVKDVEASYRFPE